MFYIRRFCEANAKYEPRCVCLSVRVEKRRCHKTDASEISNVGMVFSTSISSGFGQNLKIKALCLKNL